MEKSVISRDYSLFLKHLKNARKMAGLTQEQLAELLGETQSFISKCERGERRLDIVEVRAFCNALSVPFQSFATHLDNLLTQEARERKGQGIEANSKEARRSPAASTQTK
jgi:transcriptional regulator with XRE-family HTH domain